MILRVDFLKNNSGLCQKCNSKSLKRSKKNNSVINCKTINSVTDYKSFRNKKKTIIDLQNNLSVDVQADIYPIVNCQNYLSKY